MPFSASYFVFYLYFQQMKHHGFHHWRNRQVSKTVSILIQANPVFKKLKKMIKRALWLLLCKTGFGSIVVKQNWFANENLTSFCWFKNPVWHQLHVVVEKTQLCRNTFILLYSRQTSWYRSEKNCSLLVLCLTKTHFELSKQLSDWTEEWRLLLCQILQEMFWIEFQHRTESEAMFGRVLPLQVSQFIWQWLIKV